MESGLEDNAQNTKVTGSQPAGQSGVILDAAAPTPTSRERISSRRSSPRPTRWDRRPTGRRRGSIAPPPIPPTIDLATLDLTTHPERDLFAEFRSDRIDRAKRPRPQPRSTVIERGQSHPDTANARPARPTAVGKFADSTTSRAIGLAIAAASMTATVALWLLVVVLYF